MAASVARRRRAPPNFVKNLEFACSYYLRLSSDSFATCEVIIRYDKVVVCNYCNSPITAVTIPNAAMCLYYACRSCFGPMFLFGSTFLKSVET